jgi:hypothetical protein
LTAIGVSLASWYATDMSNYTTAIVSGLTMINLRLSDRRLCSVDTS